VRAVIGLLAVATLAAGCSSSTTGSPQPQPGADASTPPSTGAPGPPADDNTAPHVTHPLDTTKWQANPCTTMTSSQLAPLNITQPGKLTPDPKGNFCDWKPHDGVVYTLGFNTAFDPGAPKGLANIYASGPAGGMRRLPDIDGVLAVTEPSGNTNGSCTIYLGATDTMTYAIAVVIDQGMPHYADPCTPAQQLAQDVTETMKAG